MGMVALDRRIGSAFFVCCGQYGDVSRFAQEQGVSRQWLYREAEAVRDALEGTHTREVIDRLRKDNGGLQTQVAELEQRLQVAVVIDEEKQAEVACVGQACGVTLSQCRTLLEVLIAKPLSVPTLGRRTQALGEKSGALLEVFDEYARQQVRDAAADEIYVRAPVLMVVEQESLCWVSGRLSEEVSGAAWSREFAQLPNLEQTAVDGGSGLAKGLDLLNEQRQAAGERAGGAARGPFSRLVDGWRGLAPRRKAGQQGDGRSRGRSESPGRMRPARKEADRAGRPR